MKQTSIDCVYPCADRPERPEGFYSRLCPPDGNGWAEFDETALNQLADTMRESLRDSTKEVGSETQITTRLRSGYVYLGQFIDHDITRDVRRLDEAGPDVERTFNYRRAQLNLDLLYGRDPSRVPCIYENDLQRLKLARSETVAGFPSGPYDDLPRRPDGTAIVIDPRSDENAVIAQMHVLFAKFHNCALRLLEQRKDLRPPGADLFEQTRRFVTWHYQQIVVSDFLPSIVRKKVLNKIAAGKFRLFDRAYTPRDSPIALPVEFSAAAFRFGHSMVRSDYTIKNGQRSRSLKEILRMTKRGGDLKDRLPADWVIDWKEFFPERGRGNLAERIDTYLSDALHSVMIAPVYSFRLQQTLGASAGIPIDEERRSLPRLTLVRGSRMRLPSGQEFVDWCNFQSMSTASDEIVTKVTPDKICPGQEAAELFDTTNLTTRTPLWYYLLREAATEEAEPDDVVDFEGGDGLDTGTSQQKLGTLGSLIVAEVIHQLLNADCNSIKHLGAGWNATFQFGDLKDERSIDSMDTLIQFVHSSDDGQ